MADRVVALMPVQAFLHLFRAQVVVGAQPGDQLLVHVFLLLYAEYSSVRLQVDNTTPPCTNGCWSKLVSASSMDSGEKVTLSRRETGAVL